MIKVKMLDTGELRDVTRNVAFGLIDSGKAILYKGRKMLRNQKNRIMRAGRSKEYQTK